MTSLPLVSIIIPSYNQQNYLADAIESALVQPNSEVIVIDDGSTDNSLEIAKSYKDIRVISQVNKGLASARNTGIMNAKGDFILTLDADDIVLDNCVERLIEVQAETGADIVSPSFKEFGISNGDVILKSGQLELKDFQDGNKVGYMSLFKKSVLLEVGGYNPRMLEGYEDLALTCLLLSQNKKLITVQDVLWLYRTKQVSMFTKITPDVHSKLLAQINTDVPEAQLNF